MQCFFLYLDNIAVIMILDLLRPNQGVALKVIDATIIGLRSRMSLGKCLKILSLEKAVSQKERSFLIN